MEESRIWPTNERPLERLQHEGEAVLSNSEILALLLGTGERRAGNVMVLAQRLLVAAGDLQTLQQFSHAELCALPGIGPMKAARLIAAFSLARRTEQQAVGAMVCLNHPQLVVRRMQPKLRQLRHEVLLLLLLDAKQQLRREVLLSIGTTQSVQIHPRDIFHAVVREMATSFILVHNHPSGDPTPSQADIDLTKRCCEIGALLGVPLTDHVIIGGGGAPLSAYYSFCDAGKL